MTEMHSFGLVYSHTERKPIPETEKSKTMIEKRQKRKKKDRKGKKTEKRLVSRISGISSNFPTFSSEGNMKRKIS